MAVARALANEPAILLADEPTAALDTERGKSVMTLLRRLSREKNTGVIVVTHDKRMVEGFDRVYQIADGQMRVDNLRTFERLSVPILRYEPEALEVKSAKFSPRLPQKGGCWNAPAFQSAHLGIKLARQVVFEVQNFFEMAPAQILCEGGHRRLMRPGLDEPDHVEQVRPAEPRAVLDGQLSRQCRDNLFSILGPRLTEDIAPDSVADLPVQQDQFSVDRLRNAEPRRVNENPNVGGEFSNGVRDRDGGSGILGFFALPMALSTRIESG